MKKNGFMLAGFLLLCTAGNASAFYGWGCNSPYVVGWGNSWNYEVNNRQPPYYAVHPPVYYSGQIVRIPYGNSPWQGWPGYIRGGMPAVVAAVPAASAVGMMVENPHLNTTVPNKLPSPVQGAGVETNSGEMITNPYYRLTQKVAQK